MVEVAVLADALFLPLQTLITGKARPSLSLKGVACELYQLGIRDFRVGDMEVVGSFRRYEDVVSFALSGDKPNSRIVEAIPFVLATNKFDWRLLLAFARKHDVRARTRVAWLADVTLLLSSMVGFPDLNDQRGMERIIKAVKKPDKNAPPDGLGSPAPDGQRLLPVWRRWGINYSMTLNDFLNRAKALNANTNRGSKL